MKKLILLLHFALCTLTFSFAQTIAPGIEWQKTIGGDSDDVVYSIEETFDKGYIIGGISLSGISGDKTDSCNGGIDYWILKLDSIGNIQWQKTIGGNGNDLLSNISQTIDGGYICGGSSNSYSSNQKSENCLSPLQNDYWILKLDYLGNIQWENTIGGNNADILKSIKPTLDGGYICGGFSLSNISYDKTENCIGLYDFWIVKLDSIGNIVSQNSIGGDNWDQLNSVQETIDGGYICGGFSRSGISGYKTEANMGSFGGEDYWVVKLDSLLNIQWQNTIGGSAGDLLQSIQQTKDRGYICIGFSGSQQSGDKAENSLGGTDYWIIKLDTSGNIQWQNTIGGSGIDLAYSITQTQDNGFVVGGYSTSGISGDKSELSVGGADYWIIKIDSVGQIQWQKTIGGSNDDVIFSTKQISDMGYILGGTSLSDSSGNKTENSLGFNDYWIVKLYPDTTTGIKTPSSAALNTQTTPNPFTNELTVSFPQLNSAAQLTLHDVFGKQVLTQTIPAKTLYLKLQTLNLAKGVYFLQLQNGKQTETRKVIKM